MYKEHGYLWHFTLEEQMDYGPSIVAKFAHHERRVLEELGQRVRLRFACSFLLGFSWGAGGGGGGGWLGVGGTSARKYTPKLVWVTFWGQVSCFVYSELDDSAHGDNVSVVLVCMCDMYRHTSPIIQ